MLGRPRYTGGKWVSDGQVVSQVCQVVLIPFGQVRSVHGCAPPAAQQLPRRGETLAEMKRDADFSDAYTFDPALSTEIRLHRYMSVFL